MPMATKEAQREYCKLWMRKRRADFFKDKECAKCKSTERLELDHIDRVNKVTHAIWSWSKKRREEEIAKCQVLCYSCHKEKTKKDLGKPQVHGTTHSYSKYKCRCDLCKAAHAKQAREYRARKKNST